jgi:hypothetical protein
MKLRDSPPTTPTDLTAALYDAGTLPNGAIVKAMITETIETPISNLLFLTSFTPTSLLVCLLAFC